MPVYVEFSTAARNNPVENGLVEASGSLATGNASFPAPNDGFFTITADENGYLSFGAAVTNAAVDPRRRILLGNSRSFAVQKGHKVGFTAG